MNPLGAENNRCEDEECPCDHASRGGEGSSHDVGVKLRIVDAVHHLRELLDVRLELADGFAHGLADNRHDVRCEKRRDVVNPNRMLRELSGGGNGGRLSSHD